MNNRLIYCQQYDFFYEPKNSCELYQEKAYTNAMACSDIIKKTIQQQTTNRPTKTVPIVNLFEVNTNSTISICKYEQYFRNVFCSHPFSPKGRIKRIKYLIWAIIYGATYLLANSLLKSVYSNGEIYLGSVLMIFV